MDSDGGEKTIFLNSKNKDLMDLLIRHYSGYRIIGNKEFVSNIKPNIIVSECNYKCNVPECLNNSIMAIAYPESLYLIARPILLNDKGCSVFGYWTSRMNMQISNEKLCHLFFLSIPSIHRYYDIVQVKKKIIEAKGKIKRLCSLTSKLQISSSYFSIIYKNITSKTLKQFQNNIALCHAFHELVLSNKPVKEIADEYNYHANAFRFSFGQHYRTSPSSIRKMRDRLLLKKIFVI